MRLTYAVVDPKLASQSSILAHPCHVRWAWFSLVIEGQITDGMLAGLTPFQLSQLAKITIEEAEEALEIFTSPDEYSANKASDGKRLELVDESTSTYRMVTFGHHDRLIQKARDAARKRIEYYAAKLGESVEENGGSPKTPETPPPSPTPSPSPTPTKSKAGAAKGAALSPRKKSRTAMTAEWTPSPELVEAMQTECPTVDVRRQIPQFRDYWIGEGKPKADWSATFRNWIRRADGYRRGSDRRPEAPAGKPEQGRIDNIREMAREIKADLRLPDWNRCECTREQAEEWLASIAVDGCLVPDAPTLTDFLTRGDA